MVFDLFGDCNLFWISPRTYIEKITSFNKVFNFSGPKLPQFKSYETKEQISVKNNFNLCPPGEKTPTI
jgi:hypothetical protein